MSAQEVRRQLKPKSRRPGAMARGPSPGALSRDTGNQTPLFRQPDGSVGDTMPSINSFSAPSGGFTFLTPDVTNPFATTFSPFGQASNTNSDAEKRNLESEEEIARKKTFGSFSTTQSTSTSNIFGGQPAAPIQASKSLFGAPSSDPIFGNNRANSAPSAFTFSTASTASQTPSQPATNSFSASQPSNNKSPLFGNAYNFASTAASTAPTPSQPASTSFTFGQSTTPAANQTPLSTSSSFPPSIFSNSAAPASNGSLFSSNTKATPTTSEFKFGSQTSSMFNAVPSKPPSQSLFATSQPASSTAATPATDLFSGLGLPAQSAKPVSTISSATNSNPSEQTPKFFNFTESPKTQENGASGVSSIQSTLTNSALTPVTSNLFGVAATAKSQLASTPVFSFTKLGDSTSANASQPASPSSNVFNLPKPSESISGSPGSLGQQANGTNVSPSFGPISSNQDSSKDSSTKSPFSFSQPQPSQNLQPEKSSHDGSTKTPFAFGLPQPSQTSQPEKSSSDGSAKTPFTFGQPQPSQTSQTSQPLSSSLFSNLNPAQNQAASGPKPSSENNEPPAKDSGSSPSKPNSLFGNTFDLPKTAANSFMQKHKPAKPSPLSQSMTGSASPDVDRSTNSSTYQGTFEVNVNSTAGLGSILGSPSKPSSNPLQRGQTDAETKEYDASQRMRSLSNAVKASLARMPVTADLSKLLVFYNTRRDEIMRDIRRTKRKAVDDRTDEDGSGPSALKRQRQNNGQAAATSTPKFVSSGDSFKENEAVQPSRPAFETPSKPQVFMNGSTTPRGPPPTNIFAAQALKTPAPVTSKNPPQTEKPKSTTSIFSAATSTVPRNPPVKTTFESFGSKAPNFSVSKTNGISREPSPSKQVPLSSNTLTSNGFGSLNQASPTKQPSIQPPQSNLVGPFAKQSSAVSTSSTSQQQPSFSFASPGLASATASLLKADSQMTKDDSEAEQNSVSTPNGKRQATSQLTRDNFVVPEKTPSTPSAKRKAEVQLTKDNYENGANGDTHKTPKTNGTRSETSQLFKTILESPRLFSLNKSDNSTPRANPFASLGVKPSPAPAASQSPSPKTFAPASTPSFASPITNNNVASKSVFHGPNGGLANSASIFSAPNLSSAVPTQSASTDGFSFDNVQKPTETPFAASSNTGLKLPLFAATGSSVLAAEKAEKASDKTAQKPTPFGGLKLPSFGTIGSGVSAAEQFRLNAEKAALKKAVDEDYDSEDDGDKAEWIKRWKEERARKSKALIEQSKHGKGFSFSSQDEDSKKNSPEPEDSPKSLPQSPEEPLFGSSADISRATSLGPATSATGSIFNAPQKALLPIDNIFSHVSDSHNEADDEISDEGSEGDVHDDEKTDPTYDPATEPEIETSDSPVEEAGPGIASTKKLTSASTLSQSSTSGASTPKGSLFDRIEKDSDGNPIRQIAIENKENTQPSSPFSFFNSAPSNQTWNQNSPIKFGNHTTASTAPSLNFTPATPPTPKTFDLSASTKAPATVSISTSAAAPPINLFGAASTQAKPLGNLFGSAPVSSSSGSATPTPTAVSGSGLFGNNKSSSIFAGFGDSKPATIGFSFGGTSTTSSLFPSAAASTTNSRATTPGATTDNESNAATEASVEPDTEQHEQINLTESRVGEEDEEVLFECRAKAMMWMLNNKKTPPEHDWIGKGVGPLRVLKHKETGATRTLLRADPSANIALNKGLLGNFNYQPNAKTVRVLTASDDGKRLETWLLQVKTMELANDLAKVLEENKPKAN